jgi:NhaP-type Na+/H+ or K+/H+ antiporter
MTEVKLNKNSWHFKYYSNVVSDDLPKSLCPYFWTMVFIITISPVILPILGIKLLTEYLAVKLPKKEKKHRTTEEILNKFRKEDEQRLKRTVFWNKMGEVFTKYVLLPIVFLFLGYSIYVGCDALGVLGFIQMILTISVLGGVLVGLVILIEKIGRYSSRLKKYLPNLSKPLSKLLNILIKPFKIILTFIYKGLKVCGQMINAQYTKMCPLIIWEETSVKDENRI